jgi:hypothetical protein
VLFKESKLQQAKDAFMSAQIFFATFVLPPFLMVDATIDTANNWTLDKNGVTDANKYPCCGG